MTDFFIYFALILDFAWLAYLIVVFVNCCLEYNRRQTIKDLRRREAYKKVMSAKWKRESEDGVNKRKSTQEPQGL